MKIRDSTDEEANKLVRKIRGDVIESVIHLEENIDMILMSYFTTKKGTKECLDFLEMVSDPIFTLNFKIKILNRIGLFNEFKDMEINKKLQRIIEIRNILAHSFIRLYSFEFFGDIKRDIKEGVTQISPTMEVRQKKEKNKDIQELHKEFREIFEVVFIILEKKMFSMLSEKEDKNAKKKTTKE